MKKLSLLAMTVFLGISTNVFALETNVGIICEKDIALLNESLQIRTVGLNRIGITKDYASINFISGNTITYLVSAPTILNGQFCVSVSANR